MATPFRSFEIARCAEIEPRDGRTYCEPVGWQDIRLRERESGALVGPVFWTLYGRNADGTAEAVGDFRSRASAAVIADKLADGRPVDMLDSMLPPLRVTWETVTEESAEHGDIAAHGFIRPGTLDCVPVDSVPMGSADFGFRLREALDAMTDSPFRVRELEAIEPDTFPDTGAARSVRAIWRVYDAGPVLSETRTIHFPESMSPASRARVFRLLSK